MDASPGVGEGSVEQATMLPTLRLTRRPASAEVEFFSVGEPSTDIRGILVGVSFVLLESKLSSIDGASSFGSLEVSDCGHVEMYMTDSVANQQFGPLA
jgi:hypothetical protein